MNCNDERIQRLLPDYHSGHLSDDLHALVDEHLAGCLACRQSLRLMSLIADEPVDDTAVDQIGHPGPARIVQYFLDPTRIDAETARELESHLQSCTHCAGEYAFLSDLENDLRAEARVPEPSAWLRTVAYSLRDFVKKPAFAYLLLFLTIYPTLSWINTRIGGREALLLAAAGETRVLRQGLRSAGELPQVHRTKDNPLVHVRLPFYHSTGTMRYTYRMSDADRGQVGGLQFISLFRNRDAIDLLINTAGLSDGTYTLTVTELARATGTQESTVSYDFRLETKK